MAEEYYSLPEAPVYNAEEIRKIQDSDPVRASTIVNPVVQRLIENTHAVKLQVDNNKKAIISVQGVAEDAGDKAESLFQAVRQAAQVLEARVCATELVLNGKATIVQAGAPTGATEGVKGQRYIDLLTGVEWECTDVTEDGCIWGLVDHTSETCKSMRDILEETAATIAQVEGASYSSGGTWDVGELEDTTIEAGSFTNSGAGWNTCHFRDPFDAPPHVVLQPTNFSGWVEIKDITANGFLYCLRKPISTDEIETTAEKITINYIAIEYGGER